MCLSYSIDIVYVVLGRCERERVPVPVRNFLIVCPVFGIQTDFSCKESVFQKSGKYPKIMRPDENSIILLKGDQVRVSRFQNGGFWWFISHPLQVTKGNKFNFFNDSP